MSSIARAASRLATVAATKAWAAEDASEVKGHLFLTPVKDQRRKGSGGASFEAPLARGWPVEEKKSRLASSSRPKPGTSWIRVPGPL